MVSLCFCGLQLCQLTSNKAHIVQSSHKMASLTSFLLIGGKCAGLLSTALQLATSAYVFNFDEMLQCSKSFSPTDSRPQNIQQTNCRHILNSSVAYGHKIVVSKSSM